MVTELEIFSVEQRWVRTMQGSSVPGLQAESRAKLVLREMELIGSIKLLEVRRVKGCRAQRFRQAVQGSILRNPGLGLAWRRLTQ